MMTEHEDNFRFVGEYDYEGMLRFRASGTLILQRLEMAKMMFEIVYTLIVQTRVLLRNGSGYRFPCRI